MRYKLTMTTIPVILAISGCAAPYMESDAALQRRATERYATVQPGPNAKPWNYRTPSDGEIASMQSANEQERIRQIVGPNASTEQIYAVHEGLDAQYRAAARCRYEAILAGQRDDRILMHEAIVGQTFRLCMEAQ